MRPQIAPSDFSSTDFKKNQQILGEAIGCPIDALPGVIYELGAEDGEKGILLSVKGKKASAALLEYFRQRAGSDTFTIGADQASFVNAYFAPFADDPPESHPTIWFLQKPGLKTVQCVAEERSLKELVERYWAYKEAKRFDVDATLKREAYNVGLRGLRLLNYGLIRAATPSPNPELAATKAGWTTHEWVQKAILLAMQCAPIVAERVGDKVVAFDKLASAFANRSDTELAAAGRRIVRGFEQRDGSYLAPGCIGMPGFVNVGAHVEEGTMVDTWATVGSCAQIGKNVHLAGGVGIGGVLEPPGRQPVIICDNAFIGSRAIIVEGVFVGREAVIGAGVVLTASTHILDVSGSSPKEYKGEIPARSVVIPGVRSKQFPAGEYLVPCALIIGERKESTDTKTSLNDALREFDVAV